MMMFWLQFTAVSNHNAIAINRWSQHLVLAPDLKE